MLQKFNFKPHCPFVICGTPFNVLTTTREGGQRGFDHPDNHKKPASLHLHSLALPPSKHAPRRDKRPLNADMMPPIPLKVTVTRPPVIDLPKTPFLEKQLQMTAERMEFVWDNWHSQPAVVPPSPRTISTSSNPSLASSYFENSTRQLTPKVLTPKKTGLGTDKCWGIFSLKKATTGTLPTTPTSAALEIPRRTISHQTSKLLKRKIDKTQSTPNLKLKGRALRSPEVDKIAASHVPPTTRYSSHVPAAVPQTPFTATSPSFLGGIVVDSLDSSAVYFTVDPTWDTSKGDTADMFLIPFPSADALFPTSRPTLDHVVEKPWARGRAMTQFQKMPRTASYVKDMDNETSFLFLD